MYHYNIKYACIITDIAHLQLQILRSISDLKIRIFRIRK